MWIMAWPFTDLSFLNPSPQAHITIYTGSFTVGVSTEKVAPRPWLPKLSFWLVSLVSPNKNAADKGDKFCTINALFVTQQGKNKDIIKGNEEDLNVIPIILDHLLHLQEPGKKTQEKLNDIKSPSAVLWNRKERVPSWAAFSGFLFYSIRELWHGDLVSLGSSIPPRLPGCQDGSRGGEDVSQAQLRQSGLWKGMASMSSPSF